MTFPFDFERSPMSIRLILSSLAASAALCAMPGTTRAQLFVTNQTTGTIGEYTASGATVNPNLITGLSFPADVAVSGGHLFVTNEVTGTIGEYTSGATVNASLVSGLNGPAGIAVFGDKLFVTEFEDGI